MDQPKIERLLRIVKMLQDSDVDYTIEEIAQRVNVSYRTIYRYLDTLETVGFVVINKSPGVKKLCVEKRKAFDFSKLIHFSEEEAFVIDQLIEALDETNVLKQNLRRKLATVYDCAPIIQSVVQGRKAANVNRIVDAIRRKKQVILKNYSSSSSNTIRDRLVEPFELSQNYVQVWCYEPESGKNKLFKMARIEETELLSTGWQFESAHKSKAVDVFRCAMESPCRIKLLLGVRAHNLLIEEYPLAERDVSRCEDGRWMLDTVVQGFAGVGRFVLGLAHDIEIVESDELKNYLKKELQIAECNLLK